MSDSIIPACPFCGVSPGKINSVLVQLHMEDCYLYEDNKAYLSPLDLERWSRRPTEKTAFIKGSMSLASFCNTLQ